MPARGDVTNPLCPSRQVLDHLLSRWGGLALCALERGPTRFAALGRAIGGVSEKMLAQTLRGLVRDGLVSRRVEPSVPPQVEYALTPLGAEGVVHLRALVGWVEERLPAFGEAWRRADEETLGDASNGRA